MNRLLMALPLFLLAACGTSRMGGVPARMDYGAPGAQLVERKAESRQEATMADLETRVAEAELALTRFDTAGAIKLLDEFDAAVEALADTTPAQDVALGWLGAQAHEIRFIASLFREADTENLAGLYAQDAERLFNRFLADGTTTAGPACYRLFYISGREAEAERGFARMLKLVEADAVKRFRMLATKLSTCVGMGDAGDMAPIDALLAALPAAKFEDLPEYGGVKLLAALIAARANDFSGASALVQAVIEGGYPASMKPRLDRYGPGLKEIAEQWPAEQALWAAEKDLPRVEFETDQGRIVITLFEDDAPNTVASFITLTEQGFYDGLLFHRVVPHFVVQGGDPDGTGSGGPGYSIKRELGRKHFRGSIGMARGNDPDSAGSQFYFCLSAATTHHLNAGYCVFGRISEGLDVMDKLRLGGKVIRAKVLNKRAHEYKVEKLPEKE